MKKNRFSLWTTSIATLALLGFALVCLGQETENSRKNAGGGNSDLEHFLETYGPTQEAEIPVDKSSNNLSSSKSQSNSNNHQLGKEFTSSEQTQDPATTNIPYKTLQEKSIFEKLKVPPKNSNNLPKEIPFEDLQQSKPETTTQPQNNLQITNQQPDNQKDQNKSTSARQNIFK